MAVTGPLLERAAAGQTELFRSASTQSARLEAMKSLLLALALACLGVALAYNQNAPILPDPKLSPGDVLTSDTAIICVTGLHQNGAQRPAESQGTGLPRIRHHQPRVR